MAGQVLRIFRLNSGSCGGCDVEIDAAVAAGQLAWASSPYDADALLLTGPLTGASRPALDLVLQATAGRVPLIAIGRCAIDGHPHGRGGLVEQSAIVTALKLDGSPPSPADIAEAVRKVVAERRRRTSAR